MEPITREEYYLAKIAGTYEGNTPEPVTIEEYYLATMAGIIPAIPRSPSRDCSITWQR